jgi:hypothetical protein
MEYFGLSVEGVESFEDMIELEIAFTMPADVRQIHA